MVEAKIMVKAVIVENTDVNTGTSTLATIDKHVEDSTIESLVRKVKIMIEVP